MSSASWKARLARIPLVGGVLAIVGSMREVYEVVGWTDPAYHSIRSGEERLDEARKVAAIGDSQLPGPDNRGDDPGSPDQTHK